MCSPDTVRFAALRKRIPGVSQKMLSQTLQGLVADGLVTRCVENNVPPQVHYGLTDLGRSLEKRLAAPRDWAETHMRPSPSIGPDPPRAVADSAAARGEGAGTEPLRKARVGARTAAVSGQEGDRDIAVHRKREP
ncbi:winged helix-turn-helix transcriptional regulator [Nocardia carnea]|nr:helix-turn-helix domain-containing protein [Nocardia carnea]